MTDNRNQKEAFDQGVKSKIAANVTIVSVLAVLVVVFLNFAIYRLSKKKDLRFDITASKRLALERETRDFARRIEDPVKVYLVYGIDGPMRESAKKSLADRSFDTGYVDKFYRPLLARMVGGFNLIMNEVSALNPKIQARLVNSETERDEPVSLQRQLGMGPGQMLNHVVFYNTRTRAKKVISLYQFFEMSLGGPDPTLGFVAPTVSGDRIESRIVIGLRAVMKRDSKRVYVAGGHGERPLRGVTDTLRNDNYDLRPLDLINDNQKIPADCDLLLIFSPKRAWPKSALDELARFFESGGSIFLAQGMDSQEHFSSLLERLGVEMMPVQIGHPTLNVTRKGLYYLYGSDLLRPMGNTAHTITAGTIREGLPLELGFSRAYKLLQDYERDRITRHVLARSTPNSTAMPWILDGKVWRQAPERGTSKGDFPLLLALELSQSDGSASGKMVVAGGDEWLKEGALKRRIAAANLDVLMNSVYWLTETDQLIMATPRKFRGELADLSGGKEKSFMYLTVAIIPGLILMTGALVFFWRRR